MAALPVTRSGQAVEIGIRRRVGALPGNTENRPGRGGQEEEVEGGWRESLVQRLCPGDFRPHGAPKPAIRNLGQELAFGDSGSVYDTAYRRSSRRRPAWRAEPAPRRAIRRRGPRRRRRRHASPAPGWRRSSCRTSASLVSLSQSRLGGNGVRPARTRRRAPRSASQSAISRPSAPKPPVMR